MEEEFEGFSDNSRLLMSSTIQSVDEESTLAKLGNDNLK